MIDKFDLGSPNRRPKFISKDVEIVALKAIGDGEHIRYTLKQNNRI